MKKEGFTLLEVLLTLSILAVVLSILYMTFHQSVKAMADTEGQTEVIQQGRLILERMSADIRGGFISLQGGGSQTSRYGLIGRSQKEGNDFTDRLDFTTFAPSSGGEGEIFEVGYFLDHEPGGRGLTLFRRQDEAMDGNLLQGGRTLSICDGVRSLGFSFFDRQGKDQREWNSLEGVHRQVLPGRIEIHLKLEDSRGAVHAFRTQVHLPLAGEKE